LTPLVGDRLWRFGAGGRDWHWWRCLLSSTNLGTLRQSRADHIREQLLANGDQEQRDLAQFAPKRRVTRFEFVGVGHLTPPTPRSPLKPPLAPVSTASWRANRSTTTETDA
jgi:hypothetical protein